MSEGSTGSKAQSDNSLWFVLAFIVACSIPVVQRVIDDVQTSAPAAHCPRNASTTAADR